MAQYNFVVKTFHPLTVSGPLTNSLVHTAFSIVPNGVARCFVAHKSTGFSMSIEVVCALR